jgi:hypothetical protein
MSEDFIIRDQASGKFWTGTEWHAKAIPGKDARFLSLLL